MSYYEIPTPRFHSSPVLALERAVHGYCIFNGHLRREREEGV